jgi:hypothetical protein
MPILEDLKEYAERSGGPAKGRLRTSQERENPGRSASSKTVSSPTIRDGR